MTRDVAFTGTQRGMTAVQQYVVSDLLAKIRGEELTVARHGDCLGADEQFHHICRGMGGFYLVGHLPVSPIKRAFCEFDLELEPEEYLTRNRTMVRAGELLIATPAKPQERLRSGTWSTVRYARELGREVWSVLPDGRLVG